MRHHRPNLAKSNRVRHALVRPAGRRPRRDQAFSLLEMVLVVAIVAALAAIAVPRFGNSIARHRVEAAAARIAADLALAQKRAVITSTAQTVTFDPDSNSYTLKGAPHLDRSGSDYVVDLGAEPYGAALATVDFGGGTEIVFDGYGVPDTGGYVLIQVGGRQTKISVDADTGQASLP